MMLPDTLQLRAVCADDAAFLRHLYHERRQAEFSLLPLDETQKQAFCDMQLRAQDDHYARAYPALERLLITVAQQPVGRLSHARLDNGEWRVVDICLLHAQQGHGYGSTVLRWLQQQAAARQLPLSLHVASGSRALALYQRLGFVCAGQQGMDIKMLWHA